MNANNRRWSVQAGIIWAVAWMFVSAGVAPVNPVSESEAFRVVPSLGIGMYFEPNFGQMNANVRMLARGNGMLVQLTDDGMSMAASGTGTNVLTWKLGGANQAAAVSGEAPVSGQSNYFIGNREGRWVTDIPHYERARYREVYEGIDLVIHAAESAPSAVGMEYDFVVSPGANPAQIRMEFAGVDESEIDSKGNLTLRAGSSIVQHRAPLAYQMRDGKRELVAAAFKMNSSELPQVGFELAPYDHSLELIIDPVIEYGRFFGGSGEDEILSIAVDKDGFVYMSGETTSPDLPLVGGSLKYPPSVFQAKGNTLAFVAKLDPTGTKLIYCTYLGGSKTAVGHNIKIDSQGNAYIGGRTEADDFPVVKPIQPKFGGGSDDGFVAKLNPAGNALVYSTYIGGSEYDQGRALSVDGVGNVYLTGITESADFPVKNAIQARYAGRQDTFAVKLNASGDQIVYSTYLGGSGDDVGHAIAVDGSGSAYITGLTNSPNFPTANPLQRSFKGGEGDDTIVVKINPAGTALDYATFLGGSKDDEARAIAVDSGGNAVVTGYTQSADFPLAMPLQPKYGGGSHDVFVFSLSPKGNALNWSSFIGGSGADYGRGLALDGAGNVFLTGYTDSQDFPLVNSSQESYAGGSADVFYAKLDRSGKTLLLSSFLGGDAYERGRGLAADTRGNIYISGRTESENFPVNKHNSPSFGGGPNDAFIVKIREK